MVTLQHNIQYDRILVGKYVDNEYASELVPGECHHYTALYLSRGDSLIPSNG